MFQYGFRRIQTVKFKRYVALFKKNTVLKYSPVELKKFKTKQNELILGNPRFRKNDNVIIFQNYNGYYLTPSIIRETIQRTIIRL